MGRAFAVTLLSVDTVETAWEKMSAVTQNWKLGTERIGIECAAGRILAEDMYAAEAVPGFRRATVDGYALKSADTAAAGDSIPVLLKLAGTVDMGAAANCTIQHGECAYVPTGGMIPSGADAVVMLEFTENAGADIAVYEATAAGKGLVEADEDMRRGELVLRTGSCLRPAEIGTLAALGITEVPIFSPLKLALFSTGNELAAAGETLRPGKVRDINSHALSALAQQRGFSVATQRIIADNAELLEEAIRSSLETSDVIAVSGGSSCGDKDYTAAAFSHIAKPGIFTQGLALKPGKPTIFGFDQGTNTLLCGLPGHPVSALIVFELFLSRLYRSLSSQSEPITVPAHIDRNIASAPGKTCCQPVLLHQSSGGCIAEPVFGTSGMISLLTRADGYFIIGQNREGVHKGEAVQVFLF